MRRAISGVVQDCEMYFELKLLSVLIVERTREFLTRFNSHSNMILIEAYSLMFVTAIFLTLLFFFFSTTNIYIFIFIRHEGSTHSLNIQQQKTR